jgi:hypothetical protein
MMEQRECQGTSCLLGGKSKQHVMFGVSCNFRNLEHTFLACPKCVQVANRYLQSKEFGSPMSFLSSLLHILLPCLFEHGSYLTSTYITLSVDTPGFDLTSTPGLLLFEILTDAWHYALRRFVHDKKWT